MRWLVLAACGAPAAAPVANVVHASFTVRSFQTAPPGARRTECNLLPGPTWPAAEDAVLAEVARELPGRDLDSEHIEEQRMVDFLLSHESQTQEAGSDVMVAVRVTEEHGFAWIDDHAHGVRTYCIRIQHHGTTTELIPKWFEAAALDIDIAPPPP